jgi:asparagine synthase (glutamine-hydrolysing)
MCGICGVWYVNDGNGGVGQAVLHSMVEILKHRGPDGEGYYLQKGGRRAVAFGRENAAQMNGWQGRIGLGHRRLSIIDLFSGAQPLSNENRSVWIVFNGEIYNYPELRKQLEERQHQFSTQTDTETIVHLYEDYGDEHVRLLNGMFAYALWDEPRQRLFLARDCFGIKPLFYSWNGQRLLFASEIKAILEVLPRRDIDLQALHDYLSLNYVPGPRTIYGEIRKLQPGHIMIAEGNRIEIKQYSDVPFGVVKSSANGRRFSVEDAAVELRHRLRRAVAAQMVSDVPLGVFLSGGLDSSTLVGLMSEVADRPVRTFSIGFDEQSYCELPAAQLVASRFLTDHTELVIRPDIRDLLYVLVQSFDEPFGDSSAIPTFYLSQMARQHVTVALGGDGADEIFAGYQQYAATKLSAYYRRLPRLVCTSIISPLVHRLPTSDAKISFDYKAKRFVDGAALSPEQAHFSWRLIFSEDAKSELYRDGYSSRSDDSFRIFDECFAGRRAAELLDRVQYADMKVYLPDDILVKIDRMSMVNSLEVRVPFLDHDVVDFVSSLPSSFRMRGLTKKYILKRAMRNLLPSKITRGRKQGFNVPIGKWLRHELRDVVQYYLAPSMVDRHGYFNSRVITDMVRRHDERQVDYSRNIWGLLVFSIWNEQQRR